MLIWTELCADMEHMVLNLEKNFQSKLKQDIQLLQTPFMNSFLQSFRSFSLSQLMKWTEINLFKRNQCVLQQFKCLRKTKLTKLFCSLLQLMSYVPWLFCRHHQKLALLSSESYSLMKLYGFQIYRDWKYKNITTAI